MLQWRRQLARPVRQPVCPSFNGNQLALYVKLVFLKHLLVNKHWLTSRLGSEKEGSKVCMIGFANEDDSIKTQFFRSEKKKNGFAKFLTKRFYFDWLRRRKTNRFFEIRPESNRIRGVTRVARGKGAGWSTHRGEGGTPGLHLQKGCSALTPGKWGKRERGQ